METVVAVDDEDEADQAACHVQKSVHCSLTTLCDWYIIKTKVRKLQQMCTHIVHA